MLNHRNTAAGQHMMTGALGSRVDLNQNLVSCSEIHIVRTRDQK